MSDWRVLRNAETGEIVLARAKWCASYWCHLKGLQFVLRLPHSQGLLFVTDGESVVQTAIHMFFVFFTIGVVWLDASGTVVDKKLAKPWRPYYAPKKPAQYYIEANPDILDRVKIGDRLQFHEVSSG
jgi:uncharacterized membrane protein (UPF0127 family)